MKKRSKFGWLDCILGILFIALGVYTFMHPSLGVTSVVVLYSVVAIVTGIVDILFYMKVHRGIGFGPSISLVSGIISILAGVLLLLNPWMGSWILSLAFPIWFIAHSISRLANYRSIRFVAGNTMAVISATLNVLGIILGVLLFFNPMLSAHALGYLVAIALVVHGVNSIIEAFSRVGESQDAVWEILD